MKNQRLLILGMVLSTFVRANGQPSFTKITSGAIVMDKGQFAAPSWADFTGSGFLDLFIGNYAGTNVLYHNNGNGTFTRITQGDPVQDFAYHTGAAVADFDNDGYLDLLSIAGVGAPTPGHDILYHNNGNRTFSAISGGGVTNIQGFFNAAGAADYDNDGFVDLIMADNGDSSGDGGHNLLFHNNGDGTFNKITSNALNSDVIAASCMAWADYDGDGFMDLSIPSSAGTPDLNRVFLYRNNRDGTFTRILTNAVATDGWPNGAWGLAWGDYDNDGLLDLYVPGMEMGARLYHNNGNGAFTNVTSGAILQPPSGGGARSAAWGDYDNDGYLDLFVCSHDAQNRLFHNNGDGTFTQIVSAAPASDGGPGIYSEACGWVDYDNDGFLDLFVTRFSSNGQPSSNWLYRNNGNTNTWLEVKLAGTVANRSAIGANVRVRATIGGKTLWQMRELGTGSGRSSQPLVAHFGLGNATNVDTLRIEWPSGVTQEFQNVPVRQILTITEPPLLKAGMSNGVPRFSLHGERGSQYEIEASTNFTSWESLGHWTVTNINGLVDIIDTKGPETAERFYRAVSR